MNTNEAVKEARKRFGERGTAWYSAPNGTRCVGVRITSGGCTALGTGATYIEAFSVAALAKEGEGVGAPSSPAASAEPRTWAGRCECYKGHNSSSGRCNSRNVTDATGDGRVLCASCRIRCGEVLKPSPATRSGR